MAYWYGDGNKSHSSFDTLLTFCLSEPDIPSICVIIFQITALKFIYPLDKQSAMTQYLMFARLWEDTVSDYIC